MVLRGRDSGLQRLRQIALAGASLLVMTQAAEAQDLASVRELVPSLDRISIVPLTTDDPPVLADASAVSIRVSILGGPLEPALTALSKQAQLKLAYRTSLTENLTTKGIEGEFLPLEALAELLDGTGLTYRSAGSSTITLVNPRYVQLGSPDAAESIRLEELSVEAQNQNGRPSGIAGGIPSEFRGGQVARGSRVGLLGNRDYLDTPYSIVSYTDKTIRDQQATTAAEVLTNSDPSVRAAIGTGNRYDALTIRGFRIENREFALNGLYGLVPDFRTNPAPVERIELLKGPASFLYGVSPNGSVGGTVNLVTKRADPEPLTRVTLDYASTARAGTHIDVARRYGEEKQIGVRVNGSIFGGKAPIDGLLQRNGVGSIALDYIGDKLRLYGDVIYQNDFFDRPTRGYLPLAGFRIPKAPDPRINLSQYFDYSNAGSLTGLARAEYDLLPNVMLFGSIGGNRFRYDKQESPGATILDGAGNASSFSRYQAGGTIAVSGETGARARFDTGGISHEVVFTATSLDQDLTLGQITYPTYRTNIYNPVLLPAPGAPVLASSFVNGRSSFAGLTSFAGVDTLSFADGLVQMIVGVRHQEIETGNYAPTTGVLTRHYDSTAVTPTVGVVVRPTQTLSFYGNYIEGLTALTAPDTAVNTNQVFAPARTKQYEVGAKVDFQLFGATLAAFEITVPTGLTNAATRTFSIAGEQRNRGFEGTVFGEIAPGLRVLGGVTLVDGRLTKTAGGANDGNVAVGVPRFQSNVGLEWDTVTVPGLTAIARVIYTSSAYTSITNIQKIPDWTTVDLGLRYTTALAATPVTLRANITNITDGHYWIANPTGYLISGPPRTFWLSASADF